MISQDKILSSEGISPRKPSPDRQQVVFQSTRSGKCHPVASWLSGHDHDVQHLEFKGNQRSFVISGGGGAELVNWTKPSEARGPWAIAQLASLTYSFLSRLDCSRARTQPYCTSSKRSLLRGNSPSIRWESAQFFSATRMQTPDQRLCPSPDGGVLLNGITPKLFAAKGNRTSR